MKFCFEELSSKFIDVLKNVSTPTLETLDKALDVTKNLYLKNGYPLKLINGKIIILKKNSHF